MAIHKIIAVLQAGGKYSSSGPVTCYEILEIRNIDFILVGQEQPRRLCGENNNGSWLGTSGEI